MPSVLLVHPDAESCVRGLNLTQEIVTAASAKSARAYLAGTPFDLVLVGPGVEGAEAIGALRNVLGLSTTIEPIADAAALKGRLSEAVVAAEAGASDPSPPIPLSTRGASGDGLAYVAGELSRVAHSLNNPLAVIAGNAQLALEMAGALGTDETIVESLRAIGQAADELAALFVEVGALREVVDQERGRGGSA